MKSKSKMKVRVHQSTITSQAESSTKHLIGSQNKLFSGFIFLYAREMFWFVVATLMTHTGCQDHTVHHNSYCIISASYIIFLICKSKSTIEHQGSANPFETSQETKKELNYETKHLHFNECIHIHRHVSATPEIQKFDVNKKKQMTTLLQRVSLSSLSRSTKRWTGKLKNPS